MASGEMLGTYSAESVVVTFGLGLILSGFAEGTFVTAERNEKGFSITKGTTGEINRNKLADKSGKVELVLMGASPMNKILSDYANLDDATGTQVFPLTINDLSSGAAMVTAEKAWIEQIPQFKRAKEAEPVTWVFFCAKIEIIHDGTIPL